MPSTSTKKATLMSTSSEVTGDSITTQMVHTIVNWTNVVSDKGTNATQIGPTKQFTVNITTTNTTLPYFGQSYFHVGLYWLQSLQLPAFYVDLSFIVLAAFISESATRIVLREVNEGLFRRCLLDFCSSVETAFISWEIITLFEVYGKLVFSILGFCNLVQRSYRYRPYICQACPYAHVQTYLATRNDPYYPLSLKELMLRVLAQILGSLGGFRLNQTIWDMNLTVKHWYRSFTTSYGHCWTFLHVDTLHGFLIEFAGTITCGLIGYLVYDLELMPKFPGGHHGRIFLSSTGIMSTVLAAFNYTGGFFQPALATARNYGCVGYFRTNLTAADHFVVYWVGAMLGGIAVWYFYPFVRTLIKKTQRTTQRCRTKSESKEKVAILIEEPHQESPHEHAM